MKYQKCGVIGAGVIGVGVAQNLAQTKHNVVLIDISEDRLRQAGKAIGKNLAFAALFDPKVRELSQSDVLDCIEFTTDYDRLSDVDLVVENTTESWSVKKSIYPRIDEICRQDCILAANTSAILITRLASLTERPDRVIGMHFMNPVPQKTVVEVVKGWHTSEETVQAARDFLHQLGKRAIVVKDMPGFVSNRVLMLTINEAIFVVQDDVAPPSDVDEIFVKCFAHNMGPLATADLIGLDTILHTLEVLQDSLSDSKYRPCPLLRQMVAAGLLGRKSGKGFFNYPE
ncbi:MAG: 3-hydroxybutyryl-CoA dehydrogenase [Verrucomicrobiota bacterium]|jgi:3-hydroxybutyryl-CoA dehydrogenase